jgi:hypothetical protein
LQRCELFCNLELFGGFEVFRYLRRLVDGDVFSDHGCFITVLIFSYDGSLLCLLVFSYDGWLISLDIVSYLGTCTSSKTSTAPKSLALSKSSARADDGLLVAIVG